MFVKSERIGLGCKFTDAPKVTASMRAAAELLRLKYLYVAHTGTKRYMLDENICALPVSELATAQ